MNAVQHVLVFAVRLYQWAVSPLLPALFGPLARCRFEPCCSDYALEAVRLHGAARGGALAAWRLCRCGPWGGCGADPVPGPGNSNPAPPTPLGAVGGGRTPVLSRCCQE